jgi:hypothetical protein
MNEVNVNVYFERRRHRGNVNLILLVGPARDQGGGSIMPATPFSLGDHQEVPLAASFVDHAGNPATITGVPVWTSSDLTKVTVTPSTDGLTATAFAVGPLGSADVSVTATASDGSTVKGTLTINVIGEAAVSATITPGTATEEP